MTTTTHQLHRCECSDSVHEDVTCSGIPHMLVERDGERLQLCRSCHFDTDKLLHDFSDGAFIEGHDDHQIDPRHTSRLYTEAEVGELQASEGEIVRRGMQRKLDEVTSHRDQLLGQVAGQRATLNLRRRERDELRLLLNEAVTEKNRLKWQLDNSASVDEATIVELMHERDDLKASLNEAITEKARLQWRLSQVTLQRDQLTDDGEAAILELTRLKEAIADIANNYDII